MSKKKIIVSIISVLLILFAGMAIYAFSIYNKINSAAFAFFEEPTYIYIDDKKDYADVLDQLKEAGLRDENTFKKLSDYMKYPENIKSGRYEINSNLSYADLIRLLRSGNQTPVKLTFNNVRFKKDFAQRIDKQLMLDADSLLAALNNQTICRDLGFDTLTIASMFIPNTYEIYWNTNVEAFLKRMKNEYQRFWNAERTDKAKVQGLTPVEVSILASIVEEETAVLSEYPVVAGLYLNRLKKGMLLQADPTVKYAVGDVTLQRILFKHLEVDSPFNTYKYPGLPPGPIRFASIQGINAVLNPAKHTYLYMCAKEDFSGTHNFATTLSEHNRNARKYQAALNRLGIR